MCNGITTGHTAVAVSRGDIKDSDEAQFLPVLTDHGWYGTIIAPRVINFKFE